MSNKTIREVRKFRAFDGDGEQHTIHVLQEFIEVRTRGGTNTLEGIKHLKLSDGTSVNRIDKDKYEAVGIVNTPLTSDDPNAE